ncbi:Hypothetical_protein [Hexamita inflata]|uniref:Hypothetical_protein n=1 Tax=Hexamita inflata TaxID=28002 RepID=A0AA86QFU1_9EUKA|nr:Hypothetical protein HINF_LOCUS46189 [Hexamita inflata]
MGQRYWSDCSQKHIINYQAHSYQFLVIIYFSALNNVNYWIVDCSIVRFKQLRTVPIQLESKLWTQLVSFKTQLHDFSFPICFVTQFQHQNTVYTHLSPPCWARSWGASDAMSKRLCLSSRIGLAHLKEWSETFLLYTALNACDIYISKMKRIQLCQIEV